MKKRIIMASLVLTILSLAAFGFVKSNNSNINLEKTANNTLVDSNIPVTANKPVEPIAFFYNVSSRFPSIKKNTVDYATTIHDFISKEDSKQIASISSTEIILIINDRQTDIREYGNSEVLTEKQIKLLQSVDYSKHFLIRTNYKNFDSKHDDFGPHYTVVPEKQATYVSGMDALMAYIKDNKSKETRNIDPKKLQAVKVSFTITSDGTIYNVNLDRTTKYPILDNELKELVKSIPGKWEPAQNIHGEKVDQELVLSFGLDDGC